jgi:hypothetical protein
MRRGGRLSAISEALGEAHMSCQPLKPHREGIRVRIWRKLPM